MEPRTETQPAKSWQNGSNGSLGFLKSMQLIKHQGNRLISDFADKVYRANSNARFLLHIGVSSKQHIKMMYFDSFYVSKYASWYSCGIILQL